MTPSDTSPKAEAVTEVDQQAPRSPDPWGVRRAENLLTSLQGVLSARVEVSPVGEVTGIHVLTHAEISAKQMVRNVESALLAQLGLKVDHRKISIAQTAEVRAIEALGESAVREQALRRGVVFEGIEVVPAGEHRVRVTVTLTVAGTEASAGDEAADTPRARVQGAARAAVAVLDEVLPDETLELEGVKVIEAFDSELIVVGVHVVDERETRLLVGSAQVKDGASERAAVLAVLDATNRWVQSRA